MRIVSFIFLAACGDEVVNSEEETKEGEIQVDADGDGFIK